MTQKIKLTGLTCVACQKLISKRISKIDGVENVDVALDGETNINAARAISNEEIMNVLEGTKYQIV
jgi:copper chaperone CopZ